MTEKNINKKILLLTASYWAWHNVAANTLEKYYKDRWYETKIIDLVDFIDNFTWKTTQSFYQDFCSKYPKIWEKTFNILDNKKIKEIIFSTSYPIYQKKFNKLINEYNPNIVLSIFPFWGIFIKNNIDKNWKNYKSWIIITDSIKIHSIWYLEWDYIDKYFVIDEYSKEKFINKFEHKKDNVIVSFFPIDKKYFIVKKKINNKNIYILLTWLDEKYIINVLKLLVETSYNIKIIKWRNDLLYKKLQNIFLYNNIEFIDFLKLLDNYKNIGIFIWKAWWATMSECIATDTPVIVPTFIPWQEEGNIKLINKWEVWFYEPDWFKSYLLVKYIDWNKLLNNFKKIKKINSCDIIYNSFWK